MRGLILAFAGGLALARSTQAAPLGPTSIRAANVVTVQGWPNWQGGWQGGPGWGQEHERREHCWRLSAPRARGPRAHILRSALGEEGWSITSGKLESGSEVSVGARGETAIGLDVRIFVLDRVRRG